MTSNNTNQTELKDERTIQQIIADEIKENVTVRLSKDKFMSEDTTVDVKLFYKDEEFNSDSIALMGGEPGYGGSIWLLKNEC